MKCRESVFELLENRNKLPRPFDEERTIGSILMVRMDENSEPQNFTLEEYRQFVASQE